MATQGAELGVAGGFVWFDLRYGALGVADVQPLAIRARTLDAGMAALRRALAAAETEPVDAHVSS